MSNEEELPDIEQEQPNLPSPKRALIGQVLGLIINIYFVISVMIFIPYYNWQYARDHGFVGWLFLGEIVPTGKALIWPYFAFFYRSDNATWTEAEKGGLKHFSASLHAEIAADQMFDPKSASDINKVNQVIGLKRTALQESQLVEDALLEKIHPELKKHYKEEYQKYLALQIQFLESPNNQSLANQADELAKKWDAWFNLKRSDFSVPE